MRKPLRSQDTETGFTVVTANGPDEPSLQTRTPSKQTDLLNLLVAQAMLIESQLDGT